MVGSWACSWKYLKCAILKNYVGVFSSMKYVWVLCSLLVLAGCASEPLVLSEQPLHERVPAGEAEFLFVDVVEQQVPANEISFFGVRLGDSVDDVVSLHGEADVSERYELGRVVNLEYNLSLPNATAVLYHTRRGVVQSVLVTSDSEELLSYDSVLGSSRAEVLGLLGIPTRTNDLHLQRVSVYDLLGYDVYFVQGFVDRMYFTSPNRGVESAGRDAEMCAQVITPAVDPSSGECVEFPNPCIVPEDWEVVGSCSGSAPIICVDVPTGAVDPSSGECVEFDSTCAVPDGWTGCEDF